MPQKKLLWSRARTVQTVGGKEAGPRAGFHLGFNLYRHVPIWAIQLNIVRHELVEVLVKHRGFRREAVLRVVVSGRSPRLLLQGRGGSVKIKSQGWKTKWTSRGPFSALSTPIFKNKYWVMSVSINIRWKTLDEIYKIHMLLQRSDLNISSKCVNFLAFSMLEMLKSLHLFQNSSFCWFSWYLLGFSWKCRKKLQLRTSRNFSISIWFSSWLYRRCI